MKILVIGCGYLGTQVVRRLLAIGCRVDAAKRHWTPDVAVEGLRRLDLDITSADSVNQLDLDYDWVLNMVSSSRGGIDYYRDVFENGSRHIIDHFKSAPLTGLVFTSSTSVYGQIDGGLVNEKSVSEPASATGQALVNAERMLLEAQANEGLPISILRVAGIYGPKRGYLFQQYLKGEATIKGEGSRWLNMVHVDDVAGVIETMIRERSKPFLLNVSDGNPVQERDFYVWLSNQLNKPLPGQVQGETSPKTRKRALTNKRVQNDELLKRLKYRFNYPSYREGYLAEIQTMKDAGLI